MVKNKKIFVAILVSILFVIYQFVPVCKSINHNEYIDKTKFNNNDDTARYFLKYAMGATGVSWYVQDCSDKSMVGEPVMVRTFIDPRFLSINKNYELDKKGTFIVEASKKEKVIFKAQSVWCIYPQKVYIYFPDKADESTNYYLRHLSFSGYLKMFGGIFYSPWRCSY